MKSQTISEILARAVEDCLRLIVSEVLEENGRAESDTGPIESRPPKEPPTGKSDTGPIEAKSQFPSGEAKNCDWSADSSMLEADGWPKGIHAKEGYCRGERTFNAFFGEFHCSDCDWKSGKGGNHFPFFNKGGEPDLVAPGEPRYRSPSFYAVGLAPDDQAEANATKAARDRAREEAYNADAEEVAKETQAERQGIFHNRTFHDPSLAQLKEFGYFVDRRAIDQLNTDVDAVIELDALLPTNYEAKESLKLLGEARAELNCRCNGEETGWPEACLKCRINRFFGDEHDRTFRSKSQAEPEPGFYTQYARGVGGVLKYPLEPVHQTTLAFPPDEVAVTVTRETIAGNKYSKWAKDITADQICGLLLLVGEFSLRTSESEFPIEGARWSSERRKLGALRAIGQFIRKPLGEEDARGVIQDAVRGGEQKKFCKGCRGHIEPTRPHCDYCYACDMRWLEKGKKLEKSKKNA